MAMLRGIFLAIVLLAALPCGNAWPEEDTVLKNFGYKLGQLLASSDVCRDTLTPGPVEYRNKIQEFMDSIKSPMPAIATGREHDRDKCIAVLTKALKEYDVVWRELMKDPQLHGFPNPPPFFTAYVWEIPHS